MRGRQIRRLLIQHNWLTNALACREILRRRGYDDEHLTLKLDDNGEAQLVLDAYGEELTVSLGDFNYAGECPNRRLTDPEERIHFIWNASREAIDRGALPKTQLELLVENHALTRQPELLETWFDKTARPSVGPKLLN